MRTTIKKVLLAAASITVAALLVPSVSTLSAGASALPCLTGATDNAPSYSAPTTTTFSTTGKGKNATKTPTTYVSGPGTFVGHFSLQAASCPGATYTLYVSSPDGTDLHWATSTAATDTTPGATTFVYPTGYEATVSYTGDGQTLQYQVTGTTGTSGAFYAGMCINSHVEISLAGQTQQISPNVSACVGNGGGGSYF